MLHGFQTKHEVTSGIARNDVVARLESPSPAVVSVGRRQRHRDTDTIMEALVREYLARTYSCGDAKPAD
jgi:hypothetical protein